MLDSIDIEILLTIQKNPLANLNEIANQIGMSISNTSARINKLEHEQKAFTRVHADYNLSALELEFKDYFVEVESKKALNLLEDKFSYYHPYLSFRDRCSGFSNGLFMQFRVPMNSNDYLEDIFDILQKKSIVSKYWHIKRDPKEIIIRNNSALDYWDKNKNQWIFDWELWKENFNNTSSNSQPMVKSDSILNQLSELDIKLLVQIASDARRKNVDMMKNIGIGNESGNAQKISRRVRFLKENAIANYRLFLNTDVFDLFHSTLIHGQCEKSTARKIRNYLMDNQNTSSSGKVKFPFPCFFIITEEGFLWFIRSPPAEVSYILDFIWDNCANYNLYLLSYKYSDLYRLWDQTFDASKHSWKSDQNFMIDNVIKQMFK
ncbi:MAG: Lrp/AsnC family transcriptional regulator [Asgard group archaeon]|nr:Lrp/AsnC family transcriptional regulator [Asgard group archaeon]